MDLETQVETLTNIAIESSGTIPTQAGLTQILKDAAKDVTNKIMSYRPEETFRFASETAVSDGNGTTLIGPVISVVRENGSSTEVYPATEVSPDARYLATDVDSLHYRSQFNPCWYILNKKIYVLPAPASSDTQALISMVDYPALAFNDANMGNFPDEYEHAVILYACALCCLANANNLQTSFPESPVAPPLPDFATTDATLPTPPTYVKPATNVSFTNTLTEFSNEDSEMIDKRLNVIDKELEVIQKNLDTASKKYQEELDEFNKDTELRLKNAEENLKESIQEYDGKIKKYTSDIQNYSAIVQEKLASYKWFVEQYGFFMQQYNGELRLPLPSPKRKEEAPKQRTRKDRR